MFWQGPTIGVDAGADGAHTMMLVYNLPRTEAIFDRGGVAGSAYVVGGFGMTALTSNDDLNDLVVVPMRSGLGPRVGANVGYLKFTPHPDLESVLIAEAGKPRETKNELREAAGAAVAGTMLHDKKAPKGGR